MARKEDYKEFTFDLSMEGYTDNLTGEALTKGAKVYAVSRDQLYAGGAVLESTYKSMNADGKLTSSKVADAVESVSSRVRGNKD